jgi:hypothetical protein
VCGKVKIGSDVWINLQSTSIPSPNQHHDSATPFPRDEDSKEHVLIVCRGGLRLYRTNIFARTDEGRNTIVCDVTNLRHEHDAADVPFDFARWRFLEASRTGNQDHVS